ncbi:sensor histidine kinase [Ammoniphilus sp. 3BR4]|uniref:sensor histidine kinase n=1 Tax=Ammoniphilus sp. 3BR4 TaxID=3158265 RepID=UPI003466C763
MLIDTSMDNDLSFSGYPDEFRQVLINILINSLDALIESPQIDKHIRIGGHAIDKSVVIIISNNGPMIPQESLNSIFEPFFSTKKLGTGIGLYICRKIIEEHHGTLQCESDRNWTRFRMVIPQIV